MTKMAIRALGLLSGGLDSTLASKLLIDQGIEVHGVNFSTGFCIMDTRRQIRRHKTDSSNLKHEALRAGSDLQIPIDVVDVSEEYLSVVTHPRWGYGKNANPCIDCRIMMLRKAKEMMPDIGAQFIFTGEVLGQRPMTQKRFTMRQIEKQAELDGYLLRPLSALRLPETEVEKNQLVDRSRLKGIAGRSRKAQMALAMELGIEDYPQPAGGCCFLTDPSYGRKFFDFVRHLPPTHKITVEDFTLLKVGRHLRLFDHLKLITGRDEAENNFLESFIHSRWSLHPVNTVGPVGLLDGEVQQDDLDIVARIFARYCDHEAGTEVDLVIVSKDEEKEFRVQPSLPEETVRYIIK
jgi:tRNA-uridine 2-sulfurtransferase